MRPGVTDLRRALVRYDAGPGDGRAGGDCSGARRTPGVPLLAAVDARPSVLHRLAHGIERRHRQAPARHGGVGRRAVVADEIAGWRLLADRQRLAYRPRAGLQVDEAAAAPPQKIGETSPAASAWRY